MIVLSLFACLSSGVLLVAVGLRDAYVVATVLALFVSVFTDWVEGWRLPKRWGLPKLRRSEQAAELGHPELFVTLARLGGLMDVEKIELYPYPDQKVVTVGCRRLWGKSILIISEGVFAQLDMNGMEAALGAELASMGRRFRWSFVFLVANTYLAVLPALVTVGLIAGAFAGEVGFGMVLGAIVFVLGVDVLLCRWSRIASTYARISGDVASVVWTDMPEELIEVLRMKAETRGVSKDYKKSLEARIAALRELGSNAYRE